MSTTFYFREKVACDHSVTTLGQLLEPGKWYVTSASAVISSVNEADNTYLARTASPRIMKIKSCHVPRATFDVVRAT